MKSLDICINLIVIVLESDFIISYYIYQFLNNRNLISNMIGIRYAKALKINTHKKQLFYLIPITHDRYN